jgi:hypothetical protein
MWFLLLFFAFLLPDDSSRTAVAVSAQPGKIYIERSGAQQHLNFDFILQNRSQEKLIVNKIELTVFDETGKLSYRTFIDEYGRKSLELAAQPALEKQSSAMLYNPFPAFASEISLKKLHYEFSFSSEDRKKYFESEIDVFPISYETKTNLIVPVRGRVLVWDGHDYYSHHRRVDYTQEFFVKSGLKANFQRYAYDLVIVDESGSHYKGLKRLNDDWYRNDKPGAFEDYYSFGVPVYAAGAGRAIFVKDTVPDHHPFALSDLETDERALFGNYIVIDHLNGEFSIFGHLKSGSALIKAGQTVKQGEPIAAVGSTGSSLFPHLHYELRDGSGVKEVEGLPSYFSNFSRIDGSRSIKVKRGAINTGDIIDRK